MIRRWCALALCSLVLPLQASSIPPTFVGIVEAHNRLRSPLELPALRWSSVAAEQAQSWADQLALEGCPARYNPDPQRRMDYGENVLRAFSTTSYEGLLRHPAAVVARWALDGQDYDPRTGECHNPSGTRCGQYLAIIGASTLGLGCGVARCPNAEVWVCNYYPRSGPPPPRPDGEPVAGAVSAETVATP